MIDKPRGFFKLALNILTELFLSISSTSLLSHSSVHPGITHLFRAIYRNMRAWKFKEDGSPDFELIREELEPRVIDSTHEILELINAIATKVGDEPYLVKVFFHTDTDIISSAPNLEERACLPFNILVLYFKISS